MINQNINKKQWKNKWLWASLFIAVACFFALGLVPSWYASLYGISVSVLPDLTQMALQWRWLWAVLGLLPLVLVFLGLCFMPKLKMGAVFCITLLWCALMGLMMVYVLSVPFFSVDGSFSEHVQVTYRLFAAMCAEIISIFGDILGG